MGLGGIGTNGSVIWRFEHHTVRPNKKELKHDGGAGYKDNKVTVDHDVAKGKDSIAPGQIGTGGTGLVPGNFKVTLLYADPTAAANAKTAIQVLGNALVAFVPSTTANKVAPDYEPLEIQIEW